MGIEVTLFPTVRSALQFLFYLRMAPGVLLFPLSLDTHLISAPHSEAGLHGSEAEDLRDRICLRN
jgi:hypothetical protein